MWSIAKEFDFLAVCGIIRAQGYHIDWAQTGLWKTLRIEKRITSCVSVPGLGRHGLARRCWTPRHAPARPGGVALA